VDEEPGYNILASRHSKELLKLIGGWDVFCPSAKWWQPGMAGGADVGKKLVCLSELSLEGEIKAGVQW
jgi:hypothetical protein